MLVTFIDDSIPFDGQSADVVPLGGPEKSLIALAVALARRGHTVRVFNRCEGLLVADGVGWRPIKECDAAHSDWLIAHRNPRLLRHVPNADRTALWIVGNARYLGSPASLSTIKHRKSILILQSLAQSLTVPQSLQANAAEVVAPAALNCYRAAHEMAPAEPVRAVVTTHPANGLDWLLNLWIDKVVNRVPEAELHIFSSTLERGAAGADISSSLRSVLQRAMAARDKGVKIFRPIPDIKMSEIYRSARVHLYPSDHRDLICTTLGDSQSTGLPGIARDRGAARERILNGQSGYLAPDDEAFANLTVELLDDWETFSQLSRVARTRQRHRDWDRVASDFERILA